MYVNCWVCLEPLKSVSSASIFRDCMNRYCFYRWTAHENSVWIPNEYRYQFHTYRDLKELMKDVNGDGH